MLNADKPQRWKADIIASVELYNRWFLQFAPATFRAERSTATEGVLTAVAQRADLADAAIRAEQAERALAASVVADRLCGARSDPIIRNAQEARQLALLDQWLDDRGYVQSQPASTLGLTEMPPGTFAVRLVVRTGSDRPVNVPIDVVVQPKRLRPSRLPLLFELKSAGDFADVNKRRKREAKKMSQLKAHLGESVEYLLLLCGYFNAGYLGYEAAEGIDWVWEHRLADLDTLGL